MVACKFVEEYHLDNYVFFFSSRRRHTRCLSDWSSDVCSSDLHRSTETPGRSMRTAACSPRRGSAMSAPSRSEERRVGKEWGSRGSPYHYKKTNKDRMRRQARLAIKALQARG